MGKRFYGIYIQESCKDADQSTVAGLDRFFHYYTIYVKEPNGAKWEYLANFPNTVKYSDVHAYAVGRNLWYTGEIKTAEL